MRLLSSYTLALLVANLPRVISVAAEQRPILGPQTIFSQPSMGFGTWNLKISSQNTSDVVSLAIQTGYRQIDCAAVYGNEKDVGKGIKDGLKKAGLKREDIWITSKLWNDHHGDPSIVEAALNQTLEDLGIEYLDLYLMHWPVGSEKGPRKIHLDYVPTWKSMIALPKSKVLNIGISNFSPSQLRELISKTGVKPFAHQMELHPYLQQSAWLTAHEALGIAVTAYSPLANSNPTYDPKDDPKDDKNSLPPPLLRNEVVRQIAEDRNCTTAQVALAWGIGRGTSVIPKSSHAQYIKEDFEALDCELEIADLAKLKLLGTEFLHRFSNPSKQWNVELFDGLEGV